LAKESLGEPICAKISLKKGFELNPIIFVNNALFKQYDMQVLFFSNLSNLQKINNFFITKSSLSDVDFCTVCYPSFVFSENQNLKNYDLVCETLFGKKTLSITTSLVAFENIAQGYYVPNYFGDLPSGYSYEAYIFNNNSETRYNKNNQFSFSKENLQLEKEYVFYNRDQNIEFAIPGEKVVLQLVLPEIRNLDSFLGAGKILINSVNVLQNSDYQISSCKATYSEKQYFNQIEQKCLVHNYCEDCVLPNHCAKVWIEKGIIAESYNTEYAISYINEEC
jgi:hypothetical protein